MFIRENNGIKQIVVQSKLGSGGEGTVYAVEGNPDICVKIYHEQKRTPELEAKLKAMIDAPPKDPTLAAGHYSICWPTNVVYEDEACTKFLGFIMPRIERNIFKEYHLLCDKPGVTTSTCYRLEHFGTGFTYLHMYVVALNLASCVASIHAAGHAIGDLNDKNILVSTKDSKITIVDCDSFEIHGKNNQIFSCAVYMPEYSAPEVIQRQVITNRQESDRFALSILIFKLLMLNTHPYASRGSSVEHLNTPGEKIISGYYPYEEYADLDVNPPAYALPYDIIPPNIKALFRRCFVEGQHAPEQRPSAIEWFIVIKENYEVMTAKVQKKLVMCGNNARHFFPPHLTTCPWCGMKEDYFPIVIPEKRQKKTATQTVVDQFAYLREMIEDFAKDSMITSDEKSLLLQAADTKNISKRVVNELLDEKRKNNPFVIIGNPPAISETEINLEGITDEKEIVRTFTITNNFEHISLSVLIDTKTYLIKVVPQTMLLLPQKNQLFKVFINPEIINLYKDTFPIEIVYKSKRYNEKFKLNITGLKGNSLPGEKKKRIKSKTSFVIPPQQVNTEKKAEVVKKKKQKPINYGCLIGLIMLGGIALIEVIKLIGDKIAPLLVFLPFIFLIYNVFRDIANEKSNIGKSVNIIINIDPVELKKQEEQDKKNRDIEKANIFTTQCLMIFAEIALVVFAIITKKSWILMAIGLLFFMNIYFVVYESLRKK